MKTSFLSAVLTALLLLAHPGLLQADINTFSVFKVANYAQTDGAQPTVVDFPNAYYFGAQLGSNTNRVFGGTNDLMATNAYFFTPDDQQFFLATSDQMFYSYNSPFFTNQAGLDGAFVSGDYEFDINDGADFGNVMVPSNALFSASIPYFNGNTWTNLQAVDSSQPFTLTWNNFIPNSGANDTHIFLRVFDSTGFSPYAPDFLTGVTNTVILAGTLSPDTAYTIQIFFSDRLDEPASGFSGTTAIAGFDNVTAATLITLPPPAPTLSITAAGSNVVVSWPAYAINFNLQATVQTPPTTSWFFITNFTGIENGQFVVTNGISGPVEFFRLLQFGQ